MALKIVLITGGSSGIGLAATAEFSRQGYLVFEMSRHGSDHDGIVHIDGDVTSQDDCRMAIGEVVGRAGGLDVLICNAGMGISGAVEYASAAEMHRQMEVNFFGVVNMVQAALPLMRSQGHGRILIVSSLAAVFPIPYQAFYSASKSGLNALALSLRNEVKGFGIQVGVLLPGDVRTGFTQNRTKSELGGNIYGKMKSSVETMENDEKRGQSPERLAQRLYKMSKSRRLPVYTYEGWDYKCMALLQKILPQSWVNCIVGRIYKS